VAQRINLPRVGLWGVSAEGLATFVTIAVVSTLIAPFLRAATSLGALTSPGDAAPALLRFASAWLSRPEVVAAAAGVTAVGVLLIIALRAVGDAVVWGALGDATLGRTEETSRGVFAHAADQLVGAMLWRTLRLIVRSLIVGTMILVYAAVLTLNATIPPSALTAAAVAFAYAGALVWSVLMVAAVEVAPAMQVVHGMRPGEALLEGMRYAVSQPMALYRLLALALIVVLPALGVYMVATVFTPPEGALWLWSYVGAMMQAASQVLMIASVTLAGVVFRGGTFWLIADEAQLAGPLLVEQAIGVADRRSGILAHLGRKDARTGRVVVEPVDVMPEGDDTKNVLALSSLLHEEPVGDDEDRGPVVDSDE